MLGRDRLRCSGRPSSFSRDTQAYRTLTTCCTSTSSLTARCCSARMPKQRLTQSVAVAPELVASRPHSPSEGRGACAPLLSPSLIHLSTWKRDSAKFAYKAFSEVAPGLVTPPYLPSLRNTAGLRSPALLGEGAGDGQRRKLLRRAR